MTIRIGSRFALSDVASTAAAETRIAARAVPGVIRYLAPIVAWGAVSIILGVLVGLAAVVLPPLGAFSIVAVVGLVLLWVIPEVPLVAPTLVRKMFFVMLVTVLCVPNYYTVQFSGLPWISARRLAIFALIVPSLIALASSNEVRRHVAERLSSSSLILACVIGYLAMSLISIATSPMKTASLSALVDAILSWYVPFFTAIVIIKNRNDVINILKIVCYSQIFVTAAGLVEFIVQHRIFTLIFPKDMLDELILNNPASIDLILPQFRNGLFRASSLFEIPLSFGEFEIIVIPIGIFFALYRKDVSERLLGSIVVLAGVIGIFTSGSRGAYLGFLVSMAAFVTLLAMRKRHEAKASLGPALIGLFGIITFAALTILILFTGKAHHLVLGGGAESASNAGRAAQWAAAMPFIKSDPIIGNGFALGGLLIQRSIDSYVLSLLIETGIPGLVFFAGIVCIPIWYGIRAYLSDLSESGALLGSLACSFIAFTINRTVLSQRENHVLFFSLLGVFVALVYEVGKQKTLARRGEKLQQYPPYRADGRVLQKS